MLYVSHSCIRLWIWDEYCVYFLSPCRLVHCRVVPVSQEMIHLAHFSGTNHCLQSLSSTKHKCPVCSGACRFMLASSLYHIPKCSRMGFVTYYYPRDLLHCICPEEYWYKMQKATCILNFQAWRAGGIICSMLITQCTYLCITCVIRTVFHAVGWCLLMWRLQRVWSV